MTDMAKQPAALVRQNKKNKIGHDRVFPVVNTLILILLMFFGRVGGLTLIFAALSSRNTDMSQRPVEKISVG